jgi:crotonobetaine/carnitine-CoA ligase
VVRRLYRTQDLVTSNADGSLRFVERASDTIRRFGENISARAVREAIDDAYLVAECAIVGVPSDIAGHEVMLVVVPRPGKPFAPAALFERLESILPKHALPAYVCAVPTLPTTPTGKVRRDGLTELLVDAWKSPVALGAHQSTT